MNERNASTINGLSKYCLLLVLFPILLLGLTPLISCSKPQEQEATTFTMDAHDYAGNLLKGCEVEVENPSSSSKITTTYKGKEVSFIQLKESFEEWDKKGRPESGLGYARYCLYDSSGEDHIYLYMNRETSCWVIPLRDRKGEYLGASFYMDMSGYYLPENSVTHSGKISGWRESEIEADSSFYYDQAERLFASIDPDYLAKLDPSTSVSRKNVQNESNVDRVGALPEYAISWQEAPQHIGEVVTIYGPIKDSSFLAESNQQPTYIDIGAAYPDNSRVTMVVWGEDRGNFPDNPEAMYLGKTVCVTGELYAYEGATYVKVSSSNQIMVLD